MFDDSFQSDDHTQLSQDHDKEKELYFRIIGLFQALPPETASNSRTICAGHWEEINSAIDKIKTLGYEGFEHYKVFPDHDWNGPAVNLPRLKMKVNALLWEWSTKFYFENPNELLGRNGMPMLSQITHNETSANAHSNQSQSQYQEQSFEQKMQNIQRIIDENLSASQIEVIRPQLDEFKAKPNHWKNAQALIIAAAGFSKDIAIQLIGGILTIYASSLLTGKS